MSCLMECLPKPSGLDRPICYRRTEPTTDRVHVLVCDDDRWSTEWLRLTLQSQGYDVCGTARDGVEAFNLALTTFPDVVITDLSMPRMDGVELTRRLMDALPTPVLVLADPREGVLLRQALMAGAVAFLVKPFPEDRLRPAIEAAMHLFADRLAVEARLGELPGAGRRPPGTGDRLPWPRFMDGA